MKVFALSSLWFFFSLCLQRVLSNVGQPERASLPPRGWNSYNSFCWNINETEFLQNAELVVQRLKPYGYEYVVVDFLWYRRKVEGAGTNSLGFDVIDEWGRMVPDPDRWPSSKGGKGFTEVAQKVHSMGLKFGIHIMRGISLQAFNANTPILDTTKGVAYEDQDGHQWHAQDIGIKEQVCAWMPQGFMAINTMLAAGKAFLRSLYEQYAEWGVDFVKHDCAFGDDLDVEEITYVSDLLREFDQPIVYSISPGTSVAPAMAKNVSGLVNMYRITGDDWDNWKDIAAHFDVARDFASASMIGAEGLLGKSWPDLDMLPLGLLSQADSNLGPHRKCNLTLDEQKTQVTLWSIAKSPLMFGGDMRALDDTTFSLITNPTLLEINHFSSLNMEFPYVTGTKSERNAAVAWKTRSPTGGIETKTSPSSGLTSCSVPEARGWYVKTLHDVELVCWNQESSGGKYREPFCLYKRKPQLKSDEEKIYRQKYQGKYHLSTTKSTEFCLEASPRHTLMLKEFKKYSFSPCGMDANQMWELNNGSLINNYSHLCATMSADKDDLDSGEIKSWVATGRQGEIYVAFFNLNSERTTISMEILDLAKAFPSKNWTDVSCTGQEEWSQRDLGRVQKSIAVPVETHGTALIILNCH